jgi:hypothetical protein
MLYTHTCRITVPPTSSPTFVSHLAHHLVCLAGIYKGWDTLRTEGLVIKFTEVCWTCDMYNLESVTHFGGKLDFSKPHHTGKKEEKLEDAVVM